MKTAKTATPDDHPDLNLLSERLTGAAWLTALAFDGMDEDGMVLDHEAHHAVGQLLADILLDTAHELARADAARGEKP